MSRSGWKSPPCRRNERLHTSRSRGKDSPGRGILAEQRGSRGNEYAVTCTSLLEECFPDEDTQHMHQWPSPCDTVVQDVSQEQEKHQREYVTVSSVRTTVASFQPHPTCPAALHLDGEQWKSLEEDLIPPDRENLRFFFTQKQHGPAIGLTAWACRPACCAFYCLKILHLATGKPSTKGTP